jgi:hypothetical protein
MTVVDYNPEPHSEEAVRRPFEDEEGGHENVSPRERCGTGTEGSSTHDASTGSGRRENVHGAQCRKRAPGYYRNRPRGGGGGHRYKNVCVGVTGAMGGLAGTVIGAVAGDGVGSAPGGVVGTVAGTVVGEVFCQ